MLALLLLVLLLLLLSLAGHGNLLLEVGRVVHPLLPRYWDLGEWVEVPSTSVLVDYVLTSSGSWL